LSLVPNNTEDNPARASVALERTITLTDAVVAIAMTLLILPLVEVSGEVEPDRLDDFVTEAVVGRDLTTSSAPFYIGTMAVLSLLTSAIATVVDRAVPQRRHGRIAWLTTSVFVVCAIVSSVNARVGLLGLLALVLVRVVECGWNGVADDRVGDAGQVPAQTGL